MGIKTYRPYTPSRRHMTGSDFSEITKFEPEKSLLVSLKKNSGRNNQGKITVRHRGGGSRRKYRIVEAAPEENTESSISRETKKTVSRLSLLESNTIRTEQQILR